MDQDTIDSPFEDLVETKVTVRLLSSMEKRHLITMMLAFAENKIVENIDHVSMTGDSFME